MEALEKIDASTIVARLATASDREVSLLLAELARRFEPVMRRAWRELGGTPDDYPDFRQRALLKLWRTLPQLRNPNAFPGFFKTLVKNEALDALRAAKRLSGRTVSLEEIHEDIPEEVERDLDLAILVRSLLERLPPREAEVLQAVCVDGENSADVGARLGITDGAARMILSRGIRHLRDFIGNS